jgi:hypothetical protein
MMTFRLIDPSQVTSELAVRNGRVDMTGAIITAVDSGSSASRGRIEPGDNITAFDGRPQMGARDAAAAVRRWTASMRDISRYRSDVRDMIIAGADAASVGRGNNGFGPIRAIVFGPTRTVCEGRHDPMRRSPGCPIAQRRGGVRRRDTNDPSLKEYTE